jgi:hypothetical protein
MLADVSRQLAVGGERHEAYGRKAEVGYLRPAVSEIGGSAFASLRRDEQSSGGRGRTAEGGKVQGRKVGNLADVG